jgi:hypothetical protein
MGSKTKLTNKSLKDASIVSSNIATDAVTAPAIAGNAVTSAKLSDNTVAAGDLTSTLDLSSKTITLPNTSVGAPNLASTLDLSSKTVTLPSSSFNTQNFNIALLGFKKAITEGLTVFNLVDGIVDEFEDQNGNDESASTNLTYNSTDDYYYNATNPSITTTTLSTSPFSSQTFTAAGDGTVTYKLWGGGGSAGFGLDHIGGPSTGPNFNGGGGGYTTGQISIQEGDSFKVIVAGGGGKYDAPVPAGGDGVVGPGWNHGYGSAGGGLSGVFLGTTNFSSGPTTAFTNAVLIAGGGGGGGQSLSVPVGASLGGAGGGTTGQSGSGPQTIPGGSQSAGGTGNVGTISSPYFAPANSTGGKLYGGFFAPTPYNPGATDLSLVPGNSSEANYPIGAPSSGIDEGGGFGGGGPSILSFNTGPGQGICGSGGGSGYYGGGASVGNQGPQTGRGGGGGGSSYTGGTPSYSITGGSTQAGSGKTGGGQSDPQYSPTYGLGGTGFSYNTRNGTPQGVPLAQPVAYNGVVIANANYVYNSVTMTSENFNSSIVPSLGRIVVFAEISPETLNTDIVANISRNGGTNYTTVTLTDSGYVLASSGTKIYTGSADISGQPSGQSMKYQLLGSNLTNEIRIHGVSLQWA